ncbi:hypothetical protein Psi02_46400 [Planotetraspora silvatica]|uniref:Uncharacterized protein n=1 Tax=Planotetraspora silvatica TaxID=234614 RepID=A0A8J3XQB7_9ACTN|nr:hypothetical protein Psi02_46400 [Planotetraspora silvatica]
MLRRQTAVLRPGGIVAPIEFDLSRDRLLAHHAAGRAGDGLFAVFDRTGTRGAQLTNATGRSVAARPPTTEGALGPLVLDTIDEPPTGTLHQLHYRGALRTVGPYPEVNFAGCASHPPKRAPTQYLKR